MRDNVYDRNDKKYYSIYTKEGKSVLFNLIKNQVNSILFGFKKYFNLDKRSQAIKTEDLKDFEKDIKINYVREKIDIIESFLILCYH